MRQETASYTRTERQSRCCACCRQRAAVNQRYDNEKRFVWAAAYGPRCPVKLLLERGAAVSARDNRGKSADDMGRRRYPARWYTNSDPTMMRAHN